MGNLYILNIYKYVCVCKTRRQIYLHKSTCPIYVYDTWEYLGSAFLIHIKNYVCHFLKVEGKARPTCHQLCFFYLMLFVNVERPRALCTQLYMFQGSKVKFRQYRSNSLVSVFLEESHTDFSEKKPSSVFFVSV